MIFCQKFKAFFFSLKTKTKQSLEKMNVSLLHQKDQRPESLYKTK